ncbi:MAG: SEC59/DGK1/VTE5 family protein [Nanoarchaeota archaeon]|nr:SEC59/DGK1/VTE5 family protein [Nanoarchaeota archaeon]
MAKLAKKQKIDYFELRRQGFHALTGISILLFLIFNVLNKWVLAAILVLGYAIYLVNKKLKVPIIWWFVKHFERKENLKETPARGSFFYVLGCFLALVLFPKDVAYVAIIVLALGDSISTFIGKSYGKTRAPWSNVKLLEGTVAGIALSFLGFLVLYFFLPGFSVTIFEGLAACIIAMIVEALEIKVEDRKLDDNVVIPLVAGAVILILRSL